MEIYTREIFYYETDRMSIVHNANYLRIFEESRLHHVKGTAIKYTDIEDAGILIPQTEAKINYIKTLKYGDTIHVHIALTKFNGIIMKYEYAIYKNNEDKPAATGYTCHCFIDDKTRLPVSLKKRMPEVYQKMLESVDEKVD